MFGKIERIPEAFLGEQKKRVLSISAYQGYTLIKIKDGRKENAYRFYAFSEKDFQGEGSFGKVYAARVVDPDTGEFKKDIVAVKIIGSDANQSPQELYEKEREANKEVKRLRSKNFLAETPFLEARRVYVILEFAKGKELNAKEFVKDVNEAFPQAVKLIWFLSNDLNRLNHETSRGRALIHSDLKAGNSRVEVKEGKVQDARIIDFGFAQKVRDDAMHFIASQGGTYLAPEQEAKNIQGLKSDIYSFGLMCQSIFNEFEKTTPENLKPILHRFLLQMVSEDYHQRPNADDVLIFFTTLNNYLLSGEDRQNEFLEKLEVLAMPEEVLRRENLPAEFENCWRLFLYASEHYENHQEKWKELCVSLKQEMGSRPDYTWVVEFIRKYSSQQFSDEQKRYFFQFLKEFLQPNHPRREESKRCIRVLLQQNEKEWQKIVETRSVEENPAQWLREGNIPQLPTNQWRLFVCAAIDGAGMVNNNCVELKQALVRNRDALTREQSIIEKAITDFFGHKDEEYRERYDVFFRGMLKKYLNNPKPKTLESIRVIANPEAMLAAKEMPIHIRNIWRLFKVASKHYDDYKNMWELCRVRIQQNIDEKKRDFGPEDQNWFRAECKSHRSPVVLGRK
ncbi:MAG: protein kinase family protein [Gammaproteobacteria bacterium]|nr:protein kinase family protein [Gammaproteobacteria bacterium]